MSNPQTKEKETKDKKVRVFNLAKELNLESKVLLDYCKELGFAEIKNQLNGLEPDQVDSLKERVKKGPRPGNAARAPLPLPPSPSSPLPRNSPPRSRRSRRPSPRQADRRRAGARSARSSPLNRPSRAGAEPPAPEPEAPAIVAETPSRSRRRAEPAAPAPPQNIIPTIAAGGDRGT